MPISLSKEVHLLACYLIRRPATEAQTALYESAALTPGRTRDKSYRFALSHPSVLPYLDAYDAFFRPNSILRQQLYLMFSILEASPENTEMFLPRKRSRWHVLVIGGYGLRALYRLAVGLVVVKAGRLS